MTTISIGKIIAWQANRRPDHPALTYENQTLSWLELEQRTNRLARVYQQRSVAQDDLVTIALANSIEFYESAIAVWKLGATPQPVSSRLPPVERRGIVELANPKLIVGAEPGAFGERAVIESGFEPDADISDTPFPSLIARHWKAPTSGGAPGGPS